MKKGELVFVYGTLRRGERADLARQQAQFGVSFIGTDAINGKMYHLGAYPGVKTEAVDVFERTKPSVIGEVFRIRHESIIILMDTYEGYPELYERLQTRTAEGRLVWVYTYNHPVTPDQLIESGDWVKNRDPIVRSRPLRA